MMKRGATYFGLVIDSIDSLVIEVGVMIELVGEKMGQIFLETWSLECHSDKAETLASQFLAFLPSLFDTIGCPR